jgi:hypothetical protein
MGTLGNVRHAAMGHGVFGFMASGGTREVSWWLEFSQVIRMSLGEGRKKPRQESRQSFFFEQDPGCSRRPV